MSTQSTRPVPVELRWTENVIPRGCRKPRDVAFNSSATMQVRSVTSEQAPVVLRVRDDDRITEYRGLEGRLYTELGRDWKPPYGRHASFEDAERDAQDDLGKHLLLDGACWGLATEPAYEVVDNYSRHGNLYVRSYTFQDPTTAPVTSNVYAATDTDAIYALAREGVTVAFWSSIEVLDPTYVSLPPRAERIAAERVAVLTGLHDLGLRLSQITDPAMPWEITHALRKDLDDLLTRATSLGLR